MRFGQSWGCETESTRAAEPTSGGLLYLKHARRCAPVSFCSWCLIAALSVSSPLHAQQDTFRWMDFHSAKDQDVIVWVTRALEAEKWTSIREIGVIYDAALVVTTAALQSAGLARLRHLQCVERLAHHACGHTAAQRREHALAGLDAVLRSRGRRNWALSTTTAPNAPPPPISPRSTTTARSTSGTRAGSGAARPCPSGAPALPKG